MPMKKLGLILILFATLILVCIVAYNILQTSNSRNLATSVILLVKLALPPSILLTIIIAMLTHSKE
jgi:hypothetical protein